MQVQRAGDILEGRGPTPPPDQPGKAFGIKGIIRQPSQTFAFHLAATPASYPPHEQLQVDVMLATGQVADQAKLLIVKAPVATAANATGRFFWRRRKVSTRT